jgi:hypothetical protein
MSSAKDKNGLTPSASGQAALKSCKRFLLRSSTRREQIYHFGNAWTTFQAPPAGPRAQPGCASTALPHVSAETIEFLRLRRLGNGTVDVVHVPFTRLWQHELSCYCALHLAILSCCSLKFHGGRPGHCLPGSSHLAF